jgi:hypothetical protein
VPTYIALIARPSTMSTAHLSGLALLGRSRSWFKTSGPRTYCHEVFHECRPVQGYNCRDSKRIRGGQPKEGWGELRDGLQARVLSGLAEAHHSIETILDGDGKSVRLEVPIFNLDLLRDGIAAFVASAQETTTDDRLLLTGRKGPLFDVYTSTRTTVACITSEDLICRRPSDSFALQLPWQECRYLGIEAWFYRHRGGRLPVEVIILSETRVREINY